jgi:hypothetical protein
MIDRAVDALNRGEFLNEFIAVPEDLKIVAGRLGDETEQKELEIKEELNRLTYGYTNWYDYCVGEWGTKWDVGNEGGQTRKDPNSVTCSFESAWSPPTRAYEKLLDLGFEVRAYYYEPGMAFAGIWDNGDDDFYEYGGLDSAGIAETLPSALDEAFGISESVAEWEAENAEEEEE